MCTRCNDFRGAPASGEAWGERRGVSPPVGERGGVGRAARRARLNALVLVAFHAKICL
jgi:hypothetical protein